MNMQKIRLILNRNCQYDCIFCHKENVEMQNENKYLNAQDYAFFVQTAMELGYDYFSLTGGEPLLRKDIFNIVNAIALTGGKIQITTNGILLNKLNNIDCIDHINISLHTLDKNIYNYITNSNINPDVIIKNIKEFKVLNNTTIKINMLALKELTFNDKNINSLIELCEELKIDLKIIELLNPKSTLFVPFNDIQSHLQNLGYNIISDYRGGKIFKKNTSRVILQKCLCNYIKEKKDKNIYCKKINDLFLTPDGQINYCRYKKSIDVYELIKSRQGTQLKNEIKRSTDLTNQCPYK